MQPQRARVACLIESLALSDTKQLCSKAAMLIPEFQRQTSDHELGSYN